jgi:two-component system CheB/CheR fusion protein
MIERLLLRELVPPSVVCHKGGGVVHIHGRTGQFLEPAPGPQTHVSLFTMAREGLQFDLMVAIRQAAHSGSPVVRRQVRLRRNGDELTADVRVVPILTPEPLKGLFLVSFEQARTLDHDLAATDDSDDSGAPSPEARLERELQYAKHRHQSTIEELETANEELKSTNEELQSTNEELQSANEELETSKEEMQSLNEELQTVNAELQGKLDELAQANDDMKNLLDGTGIATVFLDRHLRIKRYTERAKNVVSLIPTDVGRPIADLQSKLDYDHIVQDATEVLRTLVFKEIELRGRDGKWYLMRILPYRTIENVIDGLVLTFVDVTRVKTLEESSRELRRALEHSQTSAYRQDENLRVQWAFGRVYGRPSAEVVGRRDEELMSAAAAEPMVAVKRRVLETGEPARCRVTVATADHDVQIAPLRDSTGAITGVTCVSTVSQEDTSL